MSHDSTPGISVIVPVYNGGPSFRTCLKSLTAVVRPPDEIIVVADGDTDGSAHLADRFGVRVLRLAKRGGPARARNAGARIAQNDLLFFVDADVAVHADTLDQVRDTFRREPDLAAALGSYDDAPSEANFLSQYKNLLHHFVHQIASEEASTFWGACGAIRHDVFLALGGFDERYREPCIEDIELGYRLKQRGHRIRLNKALQVKHLKHWGVISLLKADFFRRALPWTELILRDRQFVNDLNTDRSSRVSVISVYGLLGILPVAIFWPGFLGAAAILMLLLVALNAPVYRYFWKKRGLRFALQSMPWHWFYYFYSGLAFAIGAARYLLQRSEFGLGRGQFSYTEE